MNIIHIGDSIDIEFFRKPIFILKNKSNLSQKPYHLFYYC
jgi:hypothetical protein